MTTGTHHYVLADQVVEPSGTLRLDVLVHCDVEDGALKKARTMISTPGLPDYPAWWKPTTADWSRWQGAIDILEALRAAGHPTARVPRVENLLAPATAA